MFRGARSICCGGFDHMNVVHTRASYRLIEKASRRIDHSDSQTFMLSVSYTNSLQFTTLYTLPHGLPRHAQSPHGIYHGHIVGRCIVNE